MDIKDIKKGFFKLKSKPIKKDFFGEAPSVFVGRYGYPNINVGILSPPELQETAIYDAPRQCAREDYGINDVIELRSQLVNSRFKANVKSRIKFLDLTKEIAMTKTPVDIEISLKKEPKFQTHIYKFSAPTGPNAVLEKVQMTENPKIDQKVEKMVDAADLRATDALNYLYSKDFDENFLSKLLSVGNLGVKMQRRLVPSRWSITATHDTLGKNLINEVKDYSESGYLSFFGSYLGNYYLILLFPEPWSYELFETYVPEDYSKGELTYSTDYEVYSGRKDYAYDTVGGYYTVRLAVLECLRKMKRQGTVLALRFITSEYQHSIGVWVTLEAARKTLSNKPIEFSSKELMLKYAQLLVKKRFGYELDYLIKQSKILKNLKEQRKLNNFI